MLEFSIKSGNPEKQRNDCIVIGVFAGRKLSASGEALDERSGGYLTAVMKKGDMTGEAGTSLLLQKFEGMMADRVLLIGLGREKKFREEAYIKATRTAYAALAATNSVDATSFLPELPIRGREDLAWSIGQAAILACEQQHTVDDFKSDAKKNAEPRLKRLHLSVSRRVQLNEGEAGLAQGLALAQAIILAKKLGDMPPNVCTPSYLAATAEAIAAPFDNLSCTVLDEEAIAAEGMGAFLAVTKGSTEAAKFIVLNYKGAASNQAPVVLVGKGITFDTGGISLKPAAEMDEMKYDMCGAATVLACTEAVAKMGLPINLITLIPTCENMPSGHATRPGDIVTSMSGQTIEILNTDAEGRLILCDALTYAERFEPTAVIDVATLTGACIIALGHVASGLYSNDDSLSRQLVQASERSGDKVWPMPLWDDYQTQLDSRFADIGNIGGRAAGSVTAACFLARFTEKYDWAHLDIAGTAWATGKNKGATGRPVPLLVQFLQDYAKTISSDAPRRGRPPKNRDDEDNDES